MRARRSGAALQAAIAGDESAETARRYLPFFYGRWDEAARAHAAGEADQRSPAVAAGFYAEGALDPEQTRAQLAKVTAPVLVLAGAANLAARLPPPLLVPPHHHRPHQPLVPLPAPAPLRPPP